MDSVIRQWLLLSLISVTIISLGKAQTPTATARTSGQTLFDLLMQSDQLLRQQQYQQQQWGNMQHQQPLFPQQQQLQQKQQRQYGYSPMAQSSNQAPFYAYQQPPWIMYYYLMDNFI